MQDIKYRTLLPMNSRFAVELKAVLFSLFCAEYQMDLQGFEWEESAESLVGLDLYELG